MAIFWSTKAAGLPEPNFVENDEFRTIVYRKNYTEQLTGQPTGQVTGQPTGQATPQVDFEVSIEVKKVILLLDGELKRSELMEILHLNHREYFVDSYLAPALKMEYIEQTYLEIPNHPDQKYKLTEKGNEIRLTFVPKSTENSFATPQVIPPS